MWHVVGISQLSLYTKPAVPTHKATDIIGQPKEKGQETIMFNVNAYAIAQGCNRYDVS